MGDVQKVCEVSFWTAEEIDLSDDMKHWENLNPGEKHFVSHILAFFAASDGIVNENLAINFMSEVQLPEARCFYGCPDHDGEHPLGNIMRCQGSIRALNIRLKKTGCSMRIDTVPSVGKKAQWALRWINNGSFAERLDRVRGC